MDISIIKTDETLRGQICVGFFGNLRQVVSFPFELGYPFLVWGRRWKKGRERLVVTASSIRNGEAVLRAVLLFLRLMLMRLLLAGRHRHWKLGFSASEFVE